MKTINRTKLLLIISMLFGIAFIAGCETTAGAGRDLEALGENIEESAEENKNY